MNEEARCQIRLKYYDPLNNITNMYSRKHKEIARSRNDGEYQRDFTRIMYSSSFRRLQGKMQLLGIEKDQFFRNRLTHSLEVSQIARSLASKIGYSLIDTYVVESGAFAHDLGNPPFGHHGEKVLNELCEKIGGFEGNAQTLRILTTIEKKRPEFIGLNLTYRTLLSVVKYFNKFDSNLGIKSEAYNKQKFIYEDDYELLDKFVKENGIKLRTLDVQIVDLADEIAYAAHDLEDGLRHKCFTIDELLHDYKSEYGESRSFGKLKEIVENCRTSGGFGQAINSTEYSSLFRKELTSSVVNTLITDVGLVGVTKDKKVKTKTSWDKELGFENYSELANGLKKITFKCINHNDDVYRYEKVGEIVIRALFEFYKNDPKYLPPEYRAKNVIDKYGSNQKKEQLQLRLVCDYIAGMMDSYAISLFVKFFGESKLKDTIKWLDE